MDSPPLSEVSDSSLQGVENFNLQYTEETVGAVTPPDSTPATPHNQSVHHPFVYNKPHVSHASDFSSPSSSYYPDADANPAVLPSSLDFVPSTRSFWQQFPLFRREEVQNMNAQLAQHNGVQVF
jgi:hypothetical protein